MNLNRLIDMNNWYIYIALPISIIYQLCGTYNILSCCCNGHKCDARYISYRETKVQ